jgi:hypothetical protein
MRGRELSGAACQWKIRVIRSRHGQLNALIQSDRELGDEEKMGHDIERVHIRRAANLAFDSFFRRLIPA